ncbi:MAG: hypothetical protein HRU22_10070, partial [Gammaproteobacteria bacterium]|nr:hypothetical protein [Gammaproteobacteria bacterium]
GICPPGGLSDPRFPILNIGCVPPWRSPTGGGAEAGSFHGYGIAIGKASKAIKNSIAITQQEILNGKGLALLDATRPVILYCKLGSRSRQALIALQAQGITDVRNLDGGIMTWIKDVDPSMATY